MIEDKFGLKDEDYWVDPWASRRSLQRPVMRQGAEALMIGAPGVVALDAHRRLPLAILRVCPLATLSKVRLKGTAIVVAVNLGTDAVRARLAFDRVRSSSGRRSAAGKGGRRPVKDSFSDDPSAMVSEAVTVDLAQRLGVPANRGEYLLTVLMLDKVSNRCRMKLVESAAYDDPEVERFLSERQAKQRRGVVEPEASSVPLPIHRRRPHSPAVPSGTGIALAVRRVNLILRPSRSLVFGSFRLPVHPRHLAEPAEDAGDALGTESAPTAIVPITLIVTGSVDAVPKLVRLRIPSYQPVTEVDGALFATGHFTVDLYHAADLGDTAQTYFLYAFSGEVMEGPVPTAFVRLPEPRARPGAGHEAGVLHPTSGAPVARNRGG